MMFAAVAQPLAVLNRAALIRGADADLLGRPRRAVVKTVQLCRLSPELGELR